MNIKQIAGIGILIFIFIIGCSGDYGKLKTQSESESKVTQRELIDNWSDYNIWLSYYGGLRGSWLAVIVFDPKNDDRKILVGSGSNWSKVKDQEMWTEIVKVTITGLQEPRRYGVPITSFMDLLYISNLWWIR